MVPERPVGPVHPAWRPGCRGSGDRRHRRKSASNHFRRCANERLRRHARVPAAVYRRDYSQPLRMNSTIE
ncbi:hypothetical protein C6Q17_30600 [Burkholderia contaminans]|nr:hypothetical protein C6Q17_30600 [Burkholderia contaminans]